MPGRDQRIPDAMLICDNRVGENWSRTKV